MVDKLKLLMGRKIPLDEKSSVYIRQPLIKDIVDMGEDEFSNITTPFVLTTEAVFNGANNEEELISKFMMFDLFFLQVEEGKALLDDVVFNGEKALDRMKRSLSYFFDTDDITILENRHKIIINNSYIIDRDSFEHVRKVIQGVLGKKDLEVEKPPKDMSQRQKDIWFKLQKGRRRRAEKEAVYLQDLINYTSFGGSSYIPLREVEMMTYFQLTNAYKSIMGIDSYKAGMQYKLSQKFDVKDSIKHWSETIKIGK